MHGIEFYGEDRSPQGGNTRGARCAATTPTIDVQVGRNRANRFVAIDDFGHSIFCPRESSVRDNVYPTNNS